MSALTQRSAAGEARALWLAAICTLAFGLHAVNGRYEPAIGSARVRAERYYSGMLANDRLVREAAVLKRADRAAGADLQRISRGNSLSSSTAGLIAELTSMSRAHGITLLSLQPQNVQAAAGAIPSSTLSVSVRGRFRALLQFMEEMSRGATLLRVTGARLSLARAPQKKQTGPVLDAAIDAVLYRPRIPVGEGSSNAAHR